VFYSLDIGLGPFISFVSPLSSGKVGRTIQILGQGFTGTTAVSFNGTAASYTVKSDTFLTAIVPVGATTGFVTVKTPGGVLTSNKQFRVNP
jgi:large repetitive protein